jgi:hypothetical protein
MCGNSYPSVYTSIPAYLNWILDNIAPWNPRNNYPISIVISHYPFQLLCNNAGINQM